MKTKDLWIGLAMVGAAVGGAYVYHRYFTEPLVKILKVDKRNKEIVFMFGKVRTLLNYESLTQPIMIKGRNGYSIKIIKRGNMLEFKRIKNGELSGYPVLVELQ